MYSLIRKVALGVGLLCVANANAAERLSVGAMNNYLASCYANTKVENIANLSRATYSCNNILRNTWTSKQIKAETLFNRGIIYENTGDIDKALRDFKRAVKVAPELYAAHVALGLLLTKQGQFSDAVTVFDTALKLDNRDKTLIAKRNKVEQLRIQQNQNLITRIEH